MNILYQTLFRTFDSGFWTLPVFTPPPVIWDHTRQGLFVEQDSILDTVAFTSVNTFTRSNLIVILKVRGDCDVNDFCLGYASAPINPLPANGTFIRFFDQANTGRLRILTREASVTVQSNVTMTATTFTNTSQTTGTFWLAMRLDASGATVKHRMGDSGAWTLPGTQPTGTTANNLRILLNLGSVAAAAFNIIGMIVEQDTGAFTDADLDSIISASILSATTADPANTNVQRGRTLDRGIDSNLTMRLLSDGIPRTGVLQSQLALTLYKNGVAAAETFGTGFTITEIANGFYKLFIDESVLTEDGDATIWIRPVVPGSSLVDDVEINCHVTPFYGLSMFERELFVDGHEEVKKPAGGILVQRQIKDKDGAAVVVTPGLPARATPFV